MPTDKFIKKYIICDPLQAVHLLFKMHWILLKSPMG